MFTDKVALSISEIEGIIGDNLPLGATRDSEWWRNTRFTAQGRAWIDVGWNVESVDIANRKVMFIRIEKPKTKPAQKAKKKKKTAFFKRPLSYTSRKKPVLPSKTRISQVRARLRNIERQKRASQPYPSRFPTRSAYEKRLFKPDAKPSKTSG